MALPLMFPDGRLLSRRWRPLAVLALLATVLLSIVDALSYTSMVPDAIGWISYLLFGATMLACLVPLILRFRRSRDVERQQFKWVLIGLAVSVPATAVGALWSIGGGGGALSLVPLIVSPVTITVAVLRYRLYDIDVVISRTLLFAGLAGFITLTYVAIVVGLGSLVGRGDETEPGAVRGGHGARGGGVPAGAPTSAAGGEPAGLRSPGDALRRAERIRDTSGRGGGDTRDAGRAWPR